MNRDELVARLRENLRRHHIDADPIRLQKSIGGRWVVAMLSEAFSDVPALRRKDMVLEGIDPETIEWVDLLTPSEAESVGFLPSDEEPEDLPLWPEVLSKAEEPGIGPRFPSDGDEDLPLPIVATFYSLRGGVGRSTALAYTARLLAMERRKVVCIDMDLEAPGLAALFGVQDQVQDGQGVVKALLDYDLGDKPDLTKHLLRLSDEYDLYLLPAGRIGPDYARRLRLLDPESWYREDTNPLRQLMEAVRGSLPFVPDVVLVDARTGITPLSAPLLFELSDLAVIVFFPHPQAKRGTEWLVRGLLAARTYRDADPRYVPELRFIASPVPSVQEAFVRYEARAFEWIAEWMSASNEARGANEEINERDIAAVVPYLEAIAASDSVTSTGSKPPPAFDLVRDWLVRFLPSAQEERTEVSLERSKTEILEQLEFSPGTAETQSSFLENFVKTEVVSKALDVETPLVLGRKGSGKTALFRYLNESGTVNTAMIHGPSPLRGNARWQLGPEGFAEVERILSVRDLSWRDFWTLYCCVGVEAKLPPEVARPTFLQGSAFLTQSDVLNALEAAGDAPRGTLEVGEWLDRLAGVAPGMVMLLFDGLDSGFGNSETDRERRSDAVSGLFELWMERGQAVRNLRFKIVLREDIWRGLRFENKSHLYGRSVLLKWSDQATYFKVVLKQALNSRSFRALLASTASFRMTPGEVDDWPADYVFEAWTILVGERMKGGKTAFTRNWVWNRLADANNDHTPRHLLQLFHEAVPWEQQQSVAPPYFRSVIRPRALIRCLEAVSTEALDALQEEFHELDPLIDTLKHIGRTPVPADSLSSLKPIVDLAQEVGLLSVYEEKGEVPHRYKVPDIFRLALNMTRKGQA